MTTSLATSRLRAILEERLGIDCADWHEARLAEFAEEWRRRGGGPLGREGEVSADDLRRLAQEVTVGETYFFREPAQLDALVGVAIPELARRIADRPIRILSAGCSSGEEVYSILITLEERRAELPVRRITVTGVDVNRAAIAKAERARYSRWALRATPEALRDRYFRQSGEEYCLSDEIRAKASFEERNLLGTDPLFWGPGSFDVVFCRNVVIYFSDRALRRLVARFAEVLAPGGYLFLGHSETLQGISSDFERLYTQGAFCYVRKGAARAAEPPPPAEPGAWIKEIEAAAGRVDKLANVASAPVALPAAEEGLRSALRLFHEERFDDALAALRGLSGEARAEPRTKLLHALILCNRGDVADAEAACKEVLGADEQRGAAHYVLGLCREHVGDQAGALDRHREAVRIQPGFAMAHLHLGILLRRAGDPVAAAFALEQAIALLPHEKDERILLFGGGFRREALMDLCRAEMRNLGRST